MKKYINKKVLLLFFLFIILATVLSSYLNAIGYHGFLYFQTVYTTNGSRSYGNYSPRTGAFLVTGLFFLYLSLVLKKFPHSHRPFLTLVSRTIFIIGTTVFLIGGIDLVHALVFILTNYGMFAALFIH